MQQQILSSAADVTMCSQTLRMLGTGGKMCMESISSQRACVVHQIYAPLELHWQSSFSSCLQRIWEARGYALQSCLWARETAAEWITYP